MEQRFRNSLGRPSPKWKPKQRFLLLCEGKVTEPRYFRDLRNEIRSRLLDIEVVGPCGVPKTLVQYGVDRKRQADRAARGAGDSFLRYDEVWCVFDVDSHPNLGAAKQQAHDNGLRLAISNPNFELWILLHFQDHFSEEDRREIRRLCKLHLPDYGKEAPYSTLRPHYADAVRRAKHIQTVQEQRGTPGGNPSTGVYELTEKLRSSQLRL
jgi:RloB-like protein